MTKTVWGVTTPDGIFTAAPRGREQAEAWATHNFGNAIGFVHEALSTQGNAPVVLEHPNCELRIKPVGLFKSNGVWKEQPGRMDCLEDVPPFFRRFEGSYAEVAAEAVKRNKAQEHSGFVDYLFYPETVTNEAALVHAA